MCRNGDVVEGAVLLIERAVHLIERAVLLGDGEAGDFGRFLRLCGCPVDGGIEFWSTKKGEFLFCGSLMAVRELAFVPWNETWRNGCHGHAMLLGVPCQTRLR